jgi:hypothetical protein
MATKMLVLCALLALGSASTMKLKLLDNTAENGAVCLDGTPGGS